MAETPIMPCRVWRRVRLKLCCIMRKRCNARKALVNQAWLAALARSVMTLSDVRMLPMNAVLSILVLASIALVAGAIVLWRGPGFRNKAVLRLVLADGALVIVCIWPLP